MLYRMLKLATQLALPFFARKINRYHAEMQHLEGPLLIAANHPNSFLDAILIGAFMKRPVHFITRGDVFKKSWVREMLSVLNMIPIYRLRDGKKKLSLNDETFEKSIAVLRNKGILLVFVEGFCNHQTTLQLPLKKGAPRILHTCWKQGIDAKILPLWLQYSSFNRIGKTIDLRFGHPIHSSICAGRESAQCHAMINAATTNALLNLQQSQPFVHKAPGKWLRILLYLPAMGGALLHALLYLPLSGFTKYISRDTVHHDSLLFCLLFLSYPLYLIAIFISLFLSGSPIDVCIGATLALPLMALAFVHWKK